MSHVSVASVIRWPAVVFVLSVGIAGAACSGQNASNLTGPSSAGSSAAKPPTAQANGAGATVVTFENFDVSTLTVTVKTTTTAALGQPFIDEGKIQLQILVDGSGNPVPCGTLGGVFIRFDTFAVGGMNPASGVTTHSVDLDDLASRGKGVNNASCGDSICIRAHYVTGGGQTKVDTHQSDSTPYNIICAGQCTYTQGYWKTHGPIPTGNNSNEWPAVVLATGMMLGTVNYNSAQLQSIFDTPAAGNGLISLAHQLIAAKLNVANGAGDGAVAAAIAAADVLIGSLVIPPVGSGSLHPSATSGLTATLTSYNEGAIGPGHCD